MLNETLIYLGGPGERPPFGRVGDMLWGPDADIDSDGDSGTAGDIEWTELYLALRDGTDMAKIHIERVSDFPLVLGIRSVDVRLVERTVGFLSDTNGKIALRWPDLKVRKFALFTKLPVATAASDP